LLKTKLKKIAIALIFVLFLNSGMLKWMNFWPFDTTVLFGLLCGFVLIVRIILNQNKKIGIPRVVKIFLALILWIFISCLYSASNNYYLEKFFRTLLLVICVIFPILIFKNKQWIESVREAFSIFGLGCLIILTIVYIKGGFSLNNYFITANSENSNIPDYLTLGQILGVMFFINLSRNSVFWILIKTWIVLMMIMLSGRGPVLFLVIIFILNYLFKSDLSFKTLIKWCLIVIIFPLLVTFLINWKGSQLINARFQNIGKGDKSLITRENLILKTVGLIEDYPLFGIGYGSFGITVENNDGRAYPHNILLEIFVETGIIGFVFFLLFFVYIFRFYVLKLYFKSKNKISSDFCLAFIFVFIQSLKSSSIIDVRLLFGLSGIIIIMGIRCFEPTINFKHKFRLLN
jgi:O-antigen ligase